MARRLLPLFLLALSAGCAGEPEPDLPLPSCGNGVVEDGEACDDGAANSDTTPDACRSSCAFPRCGDGVRDAAERCDDGAANDDLAADACRTACVPAGCGDGVLDAGEACDDGAANDDRTPDACRTTCARSSCGDGVRDSGEACDNGTDNGDDVPGACRTDCRVPRCGDGTVDPGEACDAGEDNSDAMPDACRRVCELPRCGDGVTDAGEACDDGNADPIDGCDGCAYALPTCDEHGPAGDPTPGLPWDGGELVYDGVLSGKVLPGRLGCVPFGPGTGGDNAVLALHVLREGDLIVEVQSDAFRPAVAIREVCDLRGDACGVAAAVGGTAIAVRQGVRPADVMKWIVVESEDGATGAFRLAARIVPPLAAGAPCAAGGRAGLCGPGLACADPDGDGAGSCGPLVEAGGACDPAGLADTCVETICVCLEPGCLRGVCGTSCGEGRVQAWEECDDGDVSSADNCTPDCRLAGRFCEAPFLLNLAPVDGGFEWYGDTRLGGPTFAASCGTSWDQRDLVGAFTAPEAGTWAFRLAPEAAQPMVLSLVVDGCGSGVELACADAVRYDDTPTLTVSLAAGETVWPVVDGDGLAPNIREGAFTLRVERIVCGDGVQGIAEECDDGNAADGDGCSAACAVEATAAEANHASAAGPAGVPRSSDEAR